jgi:hypothetical protein
MRNKSLTILVVYMLVVMMTGRGFGVTFCDGKIHDIDYIIENEHVTVDREAPGIQTTVNLLKGGFIKSSYSAGHNLSADNDGRINIVGGIVSGSVNAWMNSRVTLSAGSIGMGFFGSGNSKITMSGGTVNGTSALGTLHAAESSQITFNGGRVNEYLFARENSQIDWSGGTVSNDIRLGHNAILTISGSDFKIDGMQVSNDVINSIKGGDLYNETYRRLTGTLANGETINNRFRIGDMAQIVLIPEPAALLLLSFGLVMFRRNFSEG